MLSTRLFNLLADHTFPTPLSSSFSPVANIAATWGSVAGSDRRDPTKELLNCLRVLGRVIPVVFETDTSFEHDVFWKRRIAKADGVINAEQTAPQFVIEEDEDSDNEGDRSHPQPVTGGSAPNAANSTNTGPLEPPLAEKLISASIELMFCCGFTLPSKLQVDHHKFNYTIWWAVSLHS